MTPRVSVPSYLRRTPHGRRFRVRGYTRPRRKKGTVFRFMDVGRHQVRFDNHGNFRGSRIIQDRPPQWMFTRPTPRRLATSRRP